MVIKPHGKQILGRILDVAKAQGGLLELPSTNLKNTTFFLIVDLVGPQVTKCKPGDVVLYLKGNQFYLRNGLHRLLTTEDDIMLTIEMTAEELDGCEIEGKRIVNTGDVAAMLAAPNLVFVGSTAQS
jgi:hypothetical protein